MPPELPFLGAGVIAIVGGIKREGRFPKEGMRAVVATVLLTLVASAADGTRLAPLIRAIGFLLLIGASYGTTRAFMEGAK